MQGNGFIPIIDYITIVRYFIDYSSGSWTYGWLSRLIISYVKTTKFIIEPKLDGCVIHAVLDGKGRLNILSNIFTNRDIYGFTPLQRVKFNILDNDNELQNEIDRIYNENDVVWQDPSTEPILPPTEPEPEVPEVPTEPDNPTEEPEEPEVPNEQENPEEPIENPEEPTTPTDPEAPEVISAE